MGVTPHVARLQPAVDLLAGAGEAGLATAAQLAVPPAAELPLQAPQAADDTQVRG